MQDAADVQDIQHNQQRTMQWLNICKFGGVSKWQP